MDLPFKNAFTNPFISPFEIEKDGLPKVKWRPWENHPDWDLFNVSGPSPTIFYSDTNTVETTAVIPGGVWYPIMNTDFGLVDDCEMSCIMNYEGNTPQYETYVLAKGIDENNFIGVTSYNDKIMLYERHNGNWVNPGVAVPVAGTLGKKVGLRVIGNQVSLLVDDALIGTVVTNITGWAHMGSLLRGLPIFGVLWSDMQYQGRKKTTVYYNNDITTYKGEEVKYNA